MKEHGWFSIESRDRVIVVRAHDAWNLETMQHFFAEMRALLPDMRGCDWAILYELTNWRFAIPEVMEPFRQFVAEVDHAGRSHVAVVCLDQSFSRAVLEDFVAFARQNAQVELFDSEQSAWKWLASLGLCPPPDPE